MRAETTIETRDGVYWVAGSRVWLDWVVYEFLDGQTAESIAQSFPTLSLEQVYTVTDHPTAQQRRGLQIVKAMRKRIRERFRHDHILGVPAVDVIAGELRLLTQVFVAAVAVRTLAARRV